MASYPATIPTFATVVDGVDDVLATHINTPATELKAVMDELGTDPAGSAASVKVRLAASLSDAGYLRLTGSSTLTISGGVVTKTANLHKIDTEGAASSDALDTINGGADGDVLILSLVAAARQVTITNAVGNIYCAGGTAITLATDNDFVLLIYSAALSGWRALGGGKRAESVQTKTAAYTATIYDDVILVDATAGAITITLPSATSSTGLRLTVKKADSSANAVTVDGNASETIDGATTKSLAAQWDKITVVCSGAAWYVV